jgi:hypothetical protein
MHVRMRQVCLVVRDLPAVAGLISRVFDTRVTHGSGNLSDFGIAHAHAMNPEGRGFLEGQAGVTNVTLPLGRDFIELIAPTRDDNAAARHLARRGGDGGYMFVLQARDIPAWKAQMQAVGARIVRNIDHHQYEAIHIHPADIGGAIASLGCTRPVNEADGPWYPSAWQPSDGMTSLVEGFTAATIEAADPAAMQARWQQVFRLPRSAEGLAFDNAQLRFAPAGPRGEGISSLRVATRHAREIAQRAKAAGAACSGGTLHIGGIDFELQDL